MASTAPQAHIRVLPKSKTKPKVRIGLLRPVLIAITAVAVFGTGIIIGRTTTDTQVVRSSVNTNTRTKTTKMVTPPACKTAINQATDVVTWSSDVAALALKGLKVVSSDGLDAAAPVFTKLDAMGTIGTQKMDSYANAASLCLLTGEA